MEYVIAIIVSVFSVIIAYCTLDINVSNKLFFLKKKYDDRLPSKELSKLQIKIICMIIFVLNVSATLSIMENVDNEINIVKMVIAIICITGAAYITKIKGFKHRINCIKLAFYLTSNSV